MELLTKQKRPSLIKLSSVRTYNIFIYIHKHTYIHTHTLTTSSYSSEGETGWPSDVSSVREAFKGPLLWDSLPDVNGDISCQLNLSEISQNSSNFKNQDFRIKKGKKTQVCISQFHEKTSNLKQERNRLTKMKETEQKKIWVYV